MYNIPMHRQLFFVLSMGRSGTKFFSTLLNNSTATDIIHEHPLDLAAYQLAYRKPSLGLKYFEYIRAPYIRSHMKHDKVYGEINSVLRRHLPAIVHFFPQSSIFHLIRDGRFVIRSIMSRKTMQWYDPVTKLVTPDRMDIMRDKWAYMNRFERICWYWKSENEYIEQFTDKTVKFEDLIGSYSYMSEHILSPMNIHIDMDTWHDAVKRPKNATRKYTFPHPDNWTDKMKHAFNRLCGPVMKKYNYPLF